MICKPDQTYMFLDHEITLILAADHAGFELKEGIKSGLGLHPTIKLQDLTPDLTPGDDYTEAAQGLAKRILIAPATQNTQTFGIAICGSGQGICMALNRFRGIRAGLAYNQQVAKMLRLHNHANVICLAGAILEIDQSLKIIQTFLETAEDHQARHLRRVQALDKLGNFY